MSKEIMVIEGHLFRSLGALDKAWLYLPVDNRPQLAKIRIRLKGALLELEKVRASLPPLDLREFVLPPAESEESQL